MAKTVAPVVAIKKFIELPPQHPTSVDVLQSSEERKLTMSEIKEFKASLQDGEMRELAQQACDALNELTDDEYVLKS